MRQNVWERFAHLSRFELGLNVLCRTIFVTFFNSAASMKPFPSLKYENNSALWSTCQEPTCQIFWRLLSTLQSCPGVLPGDKCSRCAILQDVHLLPHHLHELVKVEFPVSVDVVLNDKAQHLPIDLRQVGSENADRLPTPIMGNYGSPPITSSPAHFQTKCRRI